MEPIARATFHRAICNWQPSASRVATFVPPLERDRITKRRAEFGAFKMHGERVAGSGKQNWLVGLDVSEEKGEIIFSLKRAQNIGLELTPNGPKTFDIDNKERKETVCFDAAQLDIQKIRRIVNCTLSSGHKIFYFVAKEDIGKEWQVIVFTESVPPVVMEGGYKTFFILAVDDTLSTVRKKVDSGCKLVFAPPKEMIKKPEIRHLRDERLDNKFGIKSYFQILDCVIEVSTVHFRVDNDYYPYETMTFVGRDTIGYYADRYKTEEEAEQGHWQIVNIVKKGADKFLEQLDQTLAKLREREAA